MRMAPFTLYAVRNGNDNQTQQGDKYSRFLEIPHSDSICKGSDARILKAQVAM